MPPARRRPLTHRALGLVVTLCLLVQPLLGLVHLTVHEHSHGHEGHAHCGHSHDHGHPATADGAVIAGDAVAEAAGEAPADQHRPHPAEEHLESDGVQRALVGSSDGIPAPVALCAGAAPPLRIAPRVERPARVVRDTPPRAPTRSRAPSRAPPVLS
ncbi:MAG: hypothetical protein AAF957_22415 [Planctomycetota bacterium]